MSFQDVVGFTGNLVYDADKPDGTPCKLADASRIHALGWKHRVLLRNGQSFIKKNCLPCGNLMNFIK